MSATRDKLQAALAGVEIALADADHVLMSQRGNVWPKYYVECAQALLDARKAINTLADVIEKRL